MSHEYYARMQLRFCMNQWHSYSPPPTQPLGDHEQSVASHKHWQVNILNASFRVSVMAGGRWWSWDDVMVYISRQWLRPVSRRGRTFSVFMTLWREFSESVGHHAADVEQWTFFACAFGFELHFTVCKQDCLLLVFLSWNICYFVLKIFGFCSVCYLVLSFY